jgi:hypothetical protein
MKLAKGTPIAEASGHPKNTEATAVDRRSGDTNKLIALAA